MNDAAKYGVSGALKSADWQNTTLIPRYHAAGQIAELKQQPGITMRRVFVWQGSAVTSPPDKPASGRLPSRA
jgi:hypothetical protein